MNLQATSGIESAELQAVIIRADGTREDLGTIAYFHKNPLKRWLFALKKLVQRKR